MFAVALSSEKGVLHWIAEHFEQPAIWILLIVAAITVVELGGLFVELIIVRRREKIDVEKLMSDIQGKNKADITKILEGSNFSQQKKAVFAKLLNEDVSPAEADTIAVMAIADQEKRSKKIVVVTDVITHIGPMLGLMVTLIPLGPGLIALGQGDILLLAQSFLTAFDATVVGLIAASVAYVISRVRKRWYEDDLVAMDIVMEAIAPSVSERGDLACAESIA